MFVVPIMLSFQSTRVGAPPILQRMRFFRLSSAWARQVCQLRLGWSCQMPDCLPCAFSVLSGEVSQSEGRLGFCLGALDTERWASAAAGSRSEAEDGGSRLQAGVRCLQRSGLFLSKEA